jgi:group II intron reverse transcriptase/maturase
MKQKREKQQKQLKLFDSYNKPLVREECIVNAGSIIRANFFSALETQRNSTTLLMEKIVDYENLRKAVKSVRQNKGSSGVDGKEIEETISWLQQNIEHVREALLTGNFKVSPVKKVEIKKDGGGLRMLGIPTILDRIIQQSINLQLSPLYDRHFSESSYGFRKGRSAHMAILQSTEYVSSGYEWVVDIDLAKYFDTISHDRLMQRLSKGIGDKRLLRLIRSYLKAGMMTGGITEQRTKGAPQGGPLSPLLSNIVLDELDKELEKRGHKFSRFADDCNIYVKSRKSGERVMESITNFIESVLKLKVNKEKSGVRRCSKVKFLGYTIMEGGKIRVADKTISKLKQKIIRTTKRNRGVKFEFVIKELNSLIRGFGTYFRLANCWLSSFRDLDGWIRRRLRCYRLKQCGRTYTLYKFLRSLGLSEQKSWNASYWSRNGWWQLTLNLSVSKAMGLQFFRDHKLISVLNTINNRK